MTMKLASYFAGGLRIGAAGDTEIWDLRRVVALWLFAIERTAQARSIAAAMVPHDMALFIRLNHGRLDQYGEALAWVRENRAEAEAMAGPGRPLAMPLPSVRLLPPVPQPSKVICVGNSYADYLVDQKLPKDEWPKDVKISFLKSPTALIGDGETIRFPPDSREWDYENELTIVVGRTCRDVSQRDA